MRLSTTLIKSLLRSVPGVGLYYASLNFLNNLHFNYKSEHQFQHNGTSLQSFSSGFLARSFVSFVLLPVTVIKVRYESGAYHYDSVLKATKESYLKFGWIGLYPTIIRDSLFSGLYYMLYSRLKQGLTYYQNENGQVERRPSTIKGNPSVIHFVSGLISASIASFITNPADVIKTNMQLNPVRHKTMIRTAKSIYVERNGLVGFFDGLGPRMLRRTLVAALTWTMYEYIIELFK